MGTPDFIDLVALIWVQVRLPDLLLPGKEKICDLSLSFSPSFQRGSSSQPDQRPEHGL